MSRRLCGCVILLLAAAAESRCSGPDPAMPSAEESVEAAKEAIRAVSEAEFKAVAEGDVEGHLAVLGEGAVIMPPNQPAFFEKAAFASSSEQFYSQYEMTHFVHSREELVVAGEWAFERWTVSMAVAPRQGGEAVGDQVKGIHIFHRQPDGDWRLVRDIWNSDRPVSGSEDR